MRSLVSLVGSTSVGLPACGGREPAVRSVRTYLILLHLCFYAFLMIFSVHEGGWR